jgi:hypothetical protein
MLRQIHYTRILVQHEVSKLRKLTSYEKRLLLEYQLTGDPPRALKGLPEGRPYFQFRGKRLDIFLDMRSRRPS